MSSSTAAADEANTFRSAYNAYIEDLRDEQYPMLKGKTYLDHGGATLYSKSLINHFSTDMLSTLYGNPHSASTPSALAGNKVDDIRLQALQFFNADPMDFDLVFVLNATAAIKMVADCFRDYRVPGNKNAGGFWYGYHRDSHSSLVGVRELTKGRNHCFRDDEEVNRWINGNHKRSICPKKGCIGLFGFPGQSNMTGRRLPLSWASRVRARYNDNLYTLLDAAALATTCPIDLSNEEDAPDFIAVSFYKIFGFPNVGALIIRKRAGHMLQQRKYFGGGTVDMIISLDDTWHAKKQYSLHDQLEDGTLPFHSIFALGHAITVHQQLFGSMARISAHTAFLAKLLYDGMSKLTHVNDLPICRIYKDSGAIYGDPKTQGATVAFDVLNSLGMPIDFAEVEALADKHNIYVRSGGLCNPGGIATYLNYTSSELRAAFDLGHRCSKPLLLEALGGRMAGVVRVSLGAMSTISDVDALLGFLRDHYAEEISPVSQPSIVPVGQTSDPASANSVIEEKTNRHSFVKYRQNAYSQVRSGWWTRLFSKFHRLSKSPAIVSRYPAMGNI